MIIFGIVSTGLIVLLYFEGGRYAGHKDLWIPIVGFAIEIVVGVLLSIVGYAILAKSWEGYKDHRILHIIHYLSMVIISAVVPHGDFLLHMGYLHKGTNKRGIEEPFPDGFEIPKEPNSYQGYLKQQTRGGHFFLLTFGYVKCGLILIRMSLVLTFYFLQGMENFHMDFRYSPLIFMCLCSYTLFNLLMSVKLLAENTSCSLSCELFSQCCANKEKKVREDSDTDEDEDVIL